MTIDILLTQPLPESIDAEPSARYAVHRLYATDEPDALVARVASAASWRAVANGLSAALMDRLGALEIVEINGIGTDAVDLERARARRS
ncbi:hydroxyacid dehydrogenase [Burkholderia multivorans]|nr:hydroxyacid dehydrogenase [Burkholderia multivorans]MCO1384532.1 hydroxyacid dehydrogenase [Burkholderia multivorans]